MRGIGMSTGNINIAEAIKLGWKIFKNNVKYFIGMLLIVFVLYLTPEILKGLVTGNIAILLLLMGAIGWIVQRIVDLSMVKVGLKFYDGEKPKYRELLSDKETTIQYIIGTAIYFVVTGIGFLLLIVPGVILGIKLQFYSYLILDKKMDAVSALKKSFEMTNGYGLSLFIFIAAIMGLNILGGVALLVGLLATLPISFIAYAKVYRFIDGGASSESVSETVVEG